MILLNINVVMLPFGLAWAEVGARVSNVVSLISVGYWSLGMFLSFVRPMNETVYHIRLSGDQLALRAALIHLGSAYFKRQGDLHCFEPHGQTINAPLSLFKIARFLKIIRDIFHGSVIGVTFVADVAPQCNRDDSAAMYPCLRMSLC